MTRHASATIAKLALNLHDGPRSAEGFAFCRAHRYVGRGAQTRMVSGSGVPWMPANARMVLSPVLSSEFVYAVNGDLLLTARDSPHRRAFP
jgi:hypothetical protein